MYFPSLKLGVEFQGSQHFKNIEFFGGEMAFNITRQRDIQKYEECLKNDIVLLYFSDSSEYNGEDYFSKVYLDFDDLCKQIDDRIERKNGGENQSPPLS